MTIFATCFFLIGSDTMTAIPATIRDLPLPAGTNSEEYLNAFEFALKKLNEFKPEFVLISAGFDSHIQDPLAQFKLKTEDFYTIPDE